jgi:hypothetical protein
MSSRLLLTLDGLGEGLTDDTRVGDRFVGEGEEFLDGRREEGAEEGR